jgi:hypothetical protein
MMLRRRRRATLRLYTSAVRKGVRVPKMLTVDEQFEAIVADVAPVAKLDPYQEPAPKESVPAEQGDKPEEKEEK